VATVSGGAIYILGTTFDRVLDSTFYGNAVAPASWVSTASYAFIISTAESGASEARSPMWSVNDGPVFGLSTADCDMARQASVQGIGRGLAPSWPGDSPCANDTVYQSFDLYTHSLKLAEGDPEPWAVPSFSCPPVYFISDSPYKKQVGMKMTSSPMA
jgi:hypothetical protein